MNAPTASKLTETQKIEEALDRLLTATTAARQEHAIGGERGPVSMAVMSSEFIASLEHSPAQRAAAELLQRPVGEALRQAIHVLGERLNEIGGHQLMLDTCYRVAERDEANQHFRLGVLDASWNGIGAWWS